MEQNLWVAGWGTLALVNAGLAQSKNRSGLNWFLLSILPGPLATLLLVVMEKTCHQTAGLTRKMRQTETHSSELANWQIDAIQKGIEQANRGELVEHACVKAKWQMRLAEATQSNRSLPKPVAAHTNEAKDS